MTRLLIVDDDTELCALLAERLAEDGFVLTAAYDGQQGLELASSGDYSLVILDVMLPRMGGMEVLKKLRLHSSVPVLMLTARRRYRPHRRSGSRGRRLPAEAFQSERAGGPHPSDPAPFR